jgi:small subunit ribosomal protein S4
MARDTGAQCKQCRREGQKLFLKGERCLTDKCGVERRSYPPGEHGRGRQKQSEYRVQLREKQKARRYYGVLEKQFRIYYEKASRQPGITGENLLRMLECRFDNVLVRLGCRSVTGRLYRDTASPPQTGCRRRSGYMPGR